MLDPDSARLCVGLMLGHLALGVLLAPLVVFVFGARIDRGLPASGLGFRLLILPGCILLWPILFARCLRGTGELPIERNAHRQPGPTA
ncbi:hypothetical protein K2X89_05220 [Myxococcota bacterium]|nr:hypothetical protein [Myxococcota bacterium]